MGNCLGTDNGWSNKPISTGYDSHKCTVCGYSIGSAIPIYSIIFYSILFYSILFYSILFYSILFYSIIFYSILFYSILFYSILFYSILFYSPSILFYSIRLLFYSILLTITFLLYYRNSPHPLYDCIPSFHKLLQVIIHYINIVF